jgi:hypothetical protein
MHSATRREHSTARLTCQKNFALIKKPCQVSTHFHAFILFEMRTPIPCDGCFVTATEIIFCNSDLLFIYSCSFLIINDGHGLMLLGSVMQLPLLLENMSNKESRFEHILCIADDERNILKTIQHRWRMNHEEDERKEAIDFVADE